jgi:TDG/mug DNA glycosylase family protein
MKLVIVGINPGENSVRAGHYYAGRGNPFWEMLYEGGVVPEPVEYTEDKRMIEFGIGLTDLVKRPTRGIEEIRREEWTEGRVLLAQKLEEMAPKLIAFNGKTAYEKFSGRPCKPGLQKEILYGAKVFVLPSTSGQNATVSRAQKLKYFKQLGALLAKMKA